MSAGQPQHISKSNFPTKRDFLKKYGIEEATYKKADIIWTDLKIIHDDYLDHIDDLEQTASTIVNILLSKEAKDLGVHSVRYRIKSPEGLIEKIIRKRAEDSERIIDLSNYREQITDLIGVRALHVFKHDWYNIHGFIMSKWNSKEGENPKAFHREGDSNEFLNECESMGCKVEKHFKGYRSIHYIIQSAPTREICFAEVQVRTIFEEGWSEIDHKLRYVSKSESKHPLEQHLSILNRIAGSADEIGSLIKALQQQLQEASYYKESADDGTNHKEEGDA